jgi:ribonuclease HI
VIVTPSQLLLAIAEHESLEKALAALPGATREQAVKLLRGAAVQLSEAKPPPAAAAVRKPPVEDVDLRTLAPGSLKRVFVFSDGAARGNPGPAGAGAVLLDGQQHVLARLGRFLGRQTNNVAEYEGLLLGLKRAIEIGAREVDVRADSLLMIQQLKGEYRVKNEGLKPLFAEAQQLLKKFERVTLQHVPRADNALADEMSNRAIDEKME